MDECFSLVHGKGYGEFFVMKVGKNVKITWRLRTKNFTHQLRISLLISMSKKILNEKLTFRTILWHENHRSNSSHGICYFIISPWNFLKDNLYKLLLKILNYSTVGQQFLILGVIFICHLFDN